MKHSLLLSALAAFSSAVAATVEMTADADYIVDVPGDMAFSGVVPATASQTLFPGVLYPAGTEFTLFRNVNLSDVETFTAKFGGKMAKSDSAEYKWLTATAYHVNNSGSAADCQFQAMNNSYIFAIKCQFRQVGSDVVGKIAWCHYGYKSATYVLGYDFSAVGAYALCDSLFGSTVCIADVGCVLKEGVTVTPAPQRIVFANTDATDATEDVELTYGPILAGNQVFVLDGVTTDQVLAVTAEMNSTRISTDWKTGVGYNRCYENGGVAFQIQTINDSTGSYGLYNSTVTLKQNGSRIVGSVTAACWGYNQRNNPGPGYFFHHNGNGGTTLEIANEEGTGGIAIRNLKFTVRRSLVRRETFATYPDCLMRNWTKVFSDVSLDDLEQGSSFSGMDSAYLGGSGVGSVWTPVMAYLPTWVSDDQKWKIYYQTIYGGSTRSIRLSVGEFDGAIYARVKAVTWGYNKGLPYSFGDGEYQSALTDSVDGRAATAETGASNTLAIKTIGASRIVRPIHSVTLDDTFDAAGTPIRLRDVDLRLPVAADGAVGAFDATVNGFGRVTFTGLTEMASPELGPHVKVAIGETGAWVIDLSSGSVPVATFGGGLVAGGKIVFTVPSAFDGKVEFGTPYCLTSGAALADGDAEKFTAEVVGCGGIRTVLSVVDGELFAEFEEIPGLMLILR